LTYFVDRYPDETADQRQKSQAAIGAKIPDVSYSTFLMDELNFLVNRYYRFVNLASSTARFNSVIAASLPS
jgi:hypothetical protein